MTPTCWNGSCTDRPATKRVRITDIFGRTYVQEVCDHCYDFLQEHRPVVAVLKTYPAHVAQEGRDA